MQVGDFPLSWSRSRSALSTTSLSGLTHLTCVQLTQARSALSLGLTGSGSCLRGVQTPFKNDLSFVTSIRQLLALHDEHGAVSSFHIACP
jgi:hypothetical protein